MKQLKTERDGPVLLVRFDNPPKGYMDGGTLDDLEALTLEIDRDDSIRAAVYTGADPATFIYHFDTNVLSDMADGMRAKGMQFSADKLLPERNIDTVFGRIAASPKPHIAAINGNCMGGGLEFALACDLRFAKAGDYRMGQIEIALGILPGAGGVVRTAKMIGAAKAMELCLLGEAFGPADAHRLGLVNDVIEGDVVAHAMDVAQRIAAHAPLPVQHIKRIARAANEPGDRDALALERTLFLDLLVQDEAVNNLGAYNRGDLKLTDRKG
ncbi:MAG: enoyl-CoA hydratase/isomerase family protein [Minwuia sp.]|uniref:enoyl-CoA hydratase/isomerase family protein n=1 Tax=Minwuia sp. TaxID=2493630 RepID=UPI003A8896C1